MTFEEAKLLEVKSGKYKLGFITPLCWADLVRDCIDEDRLDILMEATNNAANTYAKSLQAEAWDRGSHEGYRMCIEGSSIKNPYK